jgi:sugar transferase (PEP-CTERM system associated)
MIMFLEIFNLYIPVRKLLFFFLESFFIFGMILISIGIRFRGDFSVIAITDHFFLKSLLIVLVVQMALYYFDLYNFKRFQNNLEFSNRLFQALGVASMLLAVFYYLLPQLIIGRGIFFLSIGFVMIVTFLWRIFYNFLVRRKRLDQRTLIIGTGPLAKEITTTTLEQMDTGFKVIGFISDDPLKIGTSLVNPAIIGDYLHMSELIDKEKPDRIIVALEERRGKFPIAQLLNCKMRGFTIEDGIHFYEHLTGRLHIEDLRPSAIIFSEGFNKPKFSMWIKRITEIFLSLIGLILLSPLILLIALVIKLESKGPVFYKQGRVGANGNVFKLLKFRSMKEDAEPEGPVWAQQVDPRITRVGAYLRKLRLDELPQMINVLKGDMSFVGPRPERPFFVEQLKKDIPYYDQRHTIKPGITGWAQIKYPYGDCRQDAIEKLKYDLYYIKNLSYFFDLLIIFETIKVVLFGRGAR